MLNQLINVCENFVPTGINIHIERHDQTKDVVELNGPNLRVKVDNNESAENFDLIISDEFGVKFVLPCIGVEMIKGKKEAGDYLDNQVYIYAFVRDGYLILKMNGLFMSQVKIK